MADVVWRAFGVRVRSYNPRWRRSDKKTPRFKKKMPFNGAFFFLVTRGGNVDLSGQRHVSQGTSPKSKLDMVACDDDVWRHDSMKRGPW